MAFELPALPSFQVNPTQAPSPLDAYGKMLQLKQLSGQQQLLPLEIQEQQEKAKQSAIQTQVMQAEADSQKAMVKAWSDPKFTESFTSSDAAKSSGLGFDPDGMTRALITQGVLPKDAMSITGQFIDRSQKIADTLKAQAQTGEAVAGQREKGMKILASKIGSILDLPAGQAATALQALKQDLVQNPKAYAGVPQDDLAHVYSADLEHLPAMANLIGLESQIADFHKSKADAQAAGQKVINPQTGMSPEQVSQATADVAKAQALQPLEVEKAKEVEKVHAQVEASMLPLTEQIRQTFANQKDAQDKIATQVFKPYQDKMTDVTMARNALSQAQDNPVAARAAIFKMIGVSQPTGSHRVLPAEITAFQYPGGVGTKIQEKFHNFLKGEPWTPEIAQAANAFIDGQDHAAKQSLNEGIVNTNKIYGTNVSTGLMQQLTKTYQGHTYVQQSDGSWKLQGSK